MPNDLAMAVSHAHRVLHWQENLIGDEMPPPWMWPFEDELEEWFKEVERRRKEKYGGDRDEEPDEPMVENELAQRRRGRR